MPEPKAPWVETVSGRRVSLVEPDPESISIEDIAWHLTMQCRFNGAVRKFYNVADHSIRVSQQFDDAAVFGTARKSYQLWALLHDAHEAYLGDIIRPVKLLPGVAEAIKPAARALDMAIWLAIVWPITALPWDSNVRIEIERQVKFIDDDYLRDEKFELMPPMPWPGRDIRKPAGRLAGFKPLDWFNNQKFIERFREIVYGG